MKAVIQSKHPERGYIVTFENGIVVYAETIDEAIYIKTNGLKD